MDEWRREFDSIPVPEELEFRVRAAVRQAKRDRTKAERRAAARRFWRTAGATATAAAAALVILANASPNIAFAMERVPVLGAITRVITFRTYTDTQGVASARVDVPQVEGGGEALNSAIQAYTDAIIEEYKRDSAQAEAFAQEEGAPKSESNHYALDLSYTVVTDNDAVFALRFNKELVMASGSESVRIYNVDKATGRILSLGDLFRKDSGYLDALTQNVREQMEQRMAADGRQAYWLDEENAEMNFTQLSEEAAFYIDGEGRLVLVFDEGDVAPMYMGVVEFTIPKEVTKGLALPGYLST